MFQIKGSKCIPKQTGQLMSCKDSLQATQFTTESDSIKLKEVAKIRNR